MTASSPYLNRPLRTEAQALADLERRFDGPIPPELLRAARDGRYGRLDADMRGLRALVHRTVRVIRARRKIVPVNASHAAIIIEDDAMYLRQIDEWRGTHTVLTRLRREEE